MGETTGKKIWTVDGSPEIEGLEVICFTDSINGFAGGWNNYFIKTTDGGVTWENIEIGEIGSITYSVDNGITNNTVQAGNGPWEDIIAFPNGEAYAAGPIQHIMVSYNFGETWEDGNTPQSGPSLLNLSNIQNSTIFACGYDGLMLRKVPSIIPCVADFTSDVNTIVINTNNTEGQIAFTNTCSGTIDNYEWTFEGGNPPTSNEPNPVVMYDEAGTFDVKLKVTNSMYEDEVLKVDYITVVTDESIFNINSNDINVYPVPASTTITIEFNSNLSGSKTLKIFDTMGHEITKIYSKNNDLQDIDISSLPIGSYIITIESDKGKFSKSFVKK